MPEPHVRVYAPLWELTVARTKEFAREPEAVFWVFVFPLLLALTLGLAFREKPPDRMPVGVADGPAAGGLVAALSRSPGLLARVYTLEAGRDALRRGRISLLVEEGGPPVYRFDPTRPDARAARLEVDDALQRAAGRVDTLTARDEHVKEVGSRYIDFLIPGLLGMNLMGTGMWGVGFVIVNARSRKILKRLIATPMRKSDYLLAQMLYRLAFLFVEVAVLVAFGWLAFGVAVRGSITLLVSVSVVGGIAFSGLGLLVASRARTIEAVSGWMNLVMLPMWLLSGVFFSYERFPDAAQPFIKALPLTALNDALRAVITQGASLGAVSGQVAVLAVWGLVSFTVALRIFRWQ
jgi:ABC-2 type transport system permease protein